MFHYLKKSWWLISLGLLCLLVAPYFLVKSRLQDSTPDVKHTYVMPERTSETRQNVSTKPSVTTKPVELTEPALIPREPVKMDVQIFENNIIEGLEDYKQELLTEVKQAKRQIEENENLDNMHVWIENEFAPEFEELWTDVQYISKVLDDGGNATMDELFPNASDVAYVTDVSHRLNSLLDEFAEKLAEIPSNARKEILERMESKWHWALLNQLKARSSAAVK